MVSGSLLVRVRTDGFKNTGSAFGSSPNAAYSAVLPFRDSVHQNPITSTYREREFVSTTSQTTFKCVSMGGRIHVSKRRSVILCMVVAMCVFMIVSNERIVFVTMNDFNLVPMMREEQTLKNNKSRNVERSES